MGTRSTVKGYWRQGGDSSSNTSTPAVVPSVLIIRDLDATALAGTLTGKFLPRGAIPLSVATSLGTIPPAGGTGPLLDIGLEYGSPNDDALVDGVNYEADTTTPIGDALAGSDMGFEATQEVEVTYGDDGVGTDNTSGQINIFITYVMADDGSFNN